MDLLNNLGINGKLLLAQIINFFVLFYVLKRFAFSPILKVLEERRKKIERGLADAEAAEKKLQEIEKKEKKILLKARKEADQIIRKSEAQAIKNGEIIITESRKQAEKIIIDAKKELAEEKRKMLSDVKQEVADLILLATEKAIGEKINENKDKEIIKKVVNNL